MVRGKKNFLPPAVLLLGFGVMFLISEDSKARHVKHRIQDFEVHEDSTQGTLANGSVAGGDHGDEEVPELDEDQGSVQDEKDESDEGGEDEEPVSKSNPLQTQDNAEPRIKDNEEEPPAEEMNELQLDETPKPTEEGKEEDEDASSDSDNDESRVQPSTGTQTPSQQKKGLAPPKRGRRGKAKKIANKYKDQDAEDRLAAQQLIGAAAGLEKAKADAAAKAAREAELAFQKERRRAQHQKTQKETAEHEEIRKLMLEQGEDMLDEGEEEKMMALDTLVGMTLKGDEILEAIPVCAPWAAMGRYKYKAKIQPGTQKKGKAVKEIVGKWVGDAGEKAKIDEKSEDTERMWPREVELLKGWKVEEITNTVPVGKVRVMMAGGSAGAQGKGGTSKGTGKGGRGGQGSKKR
jgi:hypothetical protein